MDVVVDTELHKWERRLLITAFGAWAAVVVAYGQTVVNRIDRVMEVFEKERAISVEVRLQNEKRISQLEFEQRQFRELLLDHKAVERLK